MNSLKVRLFICSVLCLNGFFFTLAWADSYAVRVVQAGESLGSIASLYNVSVDTLKQFNGIAEATIHPGDELLVPYMQARGGVAEQAPEPPNGFVTHTLQTGESLGVLAARYGLTLEALIGANPDISSLDLLPAGLEVLIPPAAGLVITLESDMSLREVMRTYNLKPLDLMQANNFVSPADVQPGIMVFLPGVRPELALERLAKVREAENRYMWPLHGRITSYFGRRNLGMGTSNFHRAIDVAAPSGTPITAARSGTVTYAGWSDRGYGNLIKVAHAGDAETWYAHASRIDVSVGDYVNQGDVIGRVGSTGLSTGPHLHFELHEGGEALDPLGFLR